MRIDRRARPRGLQNKTAAAMTSPRYGRDTCRGCLGVGAVVVVVVTCVFGEGGEEGGTIPLLPLSRPSGPVASGRSSAAF